MTYPIPRPGGRVALPSHRISPCAACRAGQGNSFRTRVGYDRAA
jgi:hypothetical protein